jgi:hypothetical protein
VCPEAGWLGGCRVKNACLITVPRHGVLIRFRGV